MIRALIGAVAVITLSAPSVSQTAGRTERVQFARGSSSKAIKSSVRGYDVVSYLVGVRAGQTLSVTMKTSNASSYFSVTAPGAAAAMFMGETSGNSFTAQVPSSGDYKVQVYLMRNAARRNESANYTLNVGVH